jgi:hypothetical protein
MFLPPLNANQSEKEMSINQEKRALERQRMNIVYKILHETRKSNCLYKVEKTLINPNVYIFF